MCLQKLTGSPDTTHLNAQKSRDSESAVTLKSVVQTETMTWRPSCGNISGFTHFDAAQDREAVTDTDPCGDLDLQPSIRNQRSIFGWNCGAVDRLTAPCSRAPCTAFDPRRDGLEGGAQGASALAASGSIRRPSGGKFDARRA